MPMVTVSAARQSTPAVTPEVVNLLPLVRPSAVRDPNCTAPDTQNAYPDVSHSPERARGLASGAAGAGWSGKTAAAGGGVEGVPGKPAAAGDGLYGFQGRLRCSAERGRMMPNPVEHGSNPSCRLSRCRPTLSIWAEAKRRAAGTGAL